MSKIEEAREILKELQVPTKQQTDLCCFVLLAMADIKEENLWVNATNNWIRIHDVIAYTKENYGAAYAENSRETFRKQAMHHFRNAALKENNYSEPLGKCPNCGEEIKKGKFGFYCSGKCGMNVGKVYGKELTESQLRKLLAGKEITFTSKGKKTTAFPEVVEFSYTAKNGKTLSGFQWKT